jgi:hypothetical protein
MNNCWKPTALAIFVMAACLPACAQTANLPSAPAASLPSATPPTVPGKPSFALPESTPLPPPPHSKTFVPKKDPYANEFCYGPADGIFSPSNQQIPHELQGAYNVYVSRVYAELYGDWGRYASTGERNAWGKARKAAARFVIYPDGSYSTPAITLSSDIASDDAHLLTAINRNRAFPPLPAGIKHPVPVCMIVGFHKMLEKDPSSWMTPSALPR